MTHSRHHFRRVRSSPRRRAKPRHRLLFAPEPLEGRNLLALWSGDIAVNTTWTNSEVQQITGNVRVLPGVTLTIQPGTVVKFNSFLQLGLKVDGTLLAPGTSGQPIVFTALTDDSAGGDTNGDGGSSTAYGGQWDAIQFAAGSTGSSLSHVDVRFGGSTSGGQLLVSGGGALSLSNSILSSSSSAGIRISGSSPALTNTTFVSNAIAASMDLASSPAISGVTMTANAVNALRIDGGSLSADATWNDPDITYLLHNSVTVPEGRTLTIAAGQKIKFREFSGISLTVNGTLKAQGTALAPVIFTSTRDDAAGGDAYNDGVFGGPYAGQWDALIFNSTSIGNLLDHVDVRYGASISEGQIVVDGAPLTLTNSRLFDSGRSGIRIQNANPTLTNVTFEDNASAASMDLGSNPAISSVTMTANEVNGLLVDGGVLPADATWDDPAVTYLVNNAVTVPAGRTLTIAAGQIVKFREFANFGITVNGTLRATGAAGSPIIFTSTRDDAAGGDVYNDGVFGGAYNGQWQALTFSATSSGSLLDHVEVRYGGSGAPGQVIVDGGPLTLSNSTLFDSQSAGIRIQNAAPTLTNLIYQDNAIAASMDLAASPTISGVTMTNNDVNALRVDGGTLLADAVWDDPDITYLVHNAVTIPAGRTLTIQAGQIIKFREFANLGITVNGSIRAQGNAAAPIIFTTTRDDSVGTNAYNDGAGNTAYAGQWDALVFNASSFANVLDRVELRHGGSTSGAQLLVSGGPLSLTNSTILGSSNAGVRIVGGNPALSNITFKDNAIAASMDLASNPTIIAPSLVNNGVNALLVDGGTLASDAHWDDPGIAYLVNNAVTVPSGKTLHVAAGQIIKFREFANLGINVAGTLKAIGAPGAPIIFTTTRDDSVGGNAYNDDPGNTAYAGQWDALSFQATSTASVLDQVELRYGGSQGQGQLRVAAAPLQLANSKVLSSSSAGVRVEGARPTIANVEFQSNAGAAISLDHAGDVASSGLTANGNGADAIRVDAGTLSTSTSWTGQSLPYQLSGNLTVAATGVINIGPDAVFEVRDFVHLLGTGALNNAGLIRKSTGTSTSSLEPTLANAGAIKVTSGTLDLKGGLHSSANATINGPVGPTITIGKNFLGPTTNRAGFEPQTTILFNGSASPASPQLLETFSRDLGNTGSGFDDNFAFYSLALAANTTVQLINQSDNAPEAGAEAVYVERLVVPFNATLDLNGLNLYARTTQIAGTVTNGTILTLPDGGALGRDNITPGRIAASGEIDDWTIFGRAGDALTITLSTGTNGVAPPITPALNFATLTLLDPSGAVVATATTSAAGADVTLNAVNLPADGLYHIKVQAPDSQRTSTGNYVLAAWNASVSTTPLELGRTVAGNINTPFRADRWTFSASAGQVIKFQLVSAETSAIQFDLAGPNGFTAFTNASASSSDIVLPTTGAYTLTVHTSQRQTGAYAFRIDQTTVAPLALNTPLQVNAAGGAQSHLFQVNVPLTQQLLIALADGTAGNRHEIFVKHGAIPTRADYQHRSTLAASANQQVSIPSASPGLWYVLVYTESAPQPGAFSLVASGATLFLTDVTPEFFGNSAEMTLTLAGMGFDATTAVSLVSPTSDIIATTALRFDSPTQLTATFPAGTPAGVYSINITKAGGGTATLPAAFTVKPGGSSNLVTNLVIPSALGYHIASTLYLQYSNTGDVAMPAPLLILTPTQTHADQSVTAGAHLTLDKSLVTQGFWTSATPAGFSPTVQILASGATPGVLQPGESVEVPVYYAGWQQPWDFSYPPFEFQLGVVTTNDATAIDWPLQQDELRPDDIDPAVWGVVFGHLTADFGATLGQYVAQLGQDASYLGQFGENVTDVAALWTLAMNRAIGLSPLSTLASGRDAISIAPGIPLIFDRFYSANLLGRNELGRLGRGWSDSWDYALAVAADGTVTVRGGSGSLRTFQPDSRRTGVYFSQAGDYGTLIRAGNGSFVLREQGGGQLGFRADGKLDYLADENGNRVTAEYAGTQLTGVSHTAGQSLQIAYNAAGRISSVTDAVGRQTQFTYDAANEYLTTVTDFAGRSTHYVYDTSTDAKTRHALLRVDSPGGGQQFYKYDAQGRVSQLALNGDAEQVSLQYDGNTVSLQNAVGGTVKSYFDHRGLIAKVADALGNSTYFDFDKNFNLTQVIDPLGQISTSTFDARGNLTRFTNPLGQTTTFEFSGSLNQLSRFVDAKGNATRYSYDASGNLLSTTYADGSREQQSSDSQGNRTSWTNRRGQTIGYTYDAAGRVVSKTRSNGARTDLTYDAHGNLATVVDASGTISFTYDAADRPTRVTYPSGKFVQFAYDAAGRRTQLSDQDGFTVGYLYDEAGRLQQLTTGSGAPIVTYAYDAAGRLVTKTTGEGGRSEWEYNPAGQLLNLRNLGPGTNLHSQFEYTYDALGRTVSTITNLGTWTYAYDASSQLTRATFASNQLAVVPHRDEQYFYDAAGNRMRTIVDGVEVEYVANLLNQYTRIGTTIFTYDLDGNLLQQHDGLNTTSFVYDDENQLISSHSAAETALFEYDALSNRVAAVKNGVRTDYLLDPLGLGMVVAEYRGQVREASYTYGLGLVSRLSAGGTSSYYEFDARGNTVGLTSGAGTLANQYVYSPFGQLQSSSVTIANPFTFAGKFAVIDDTAGHFSMRAREYNAATGQFFSDDPLGLAGGDTNLRRYVVNNPLSSVDPSGLGRFGKEGLLPIIPNYIPLVYDFLSLNYMEPVHEEFFFDHATKVDSQRASINAGFGGQRFQNRSAYTMDDQYFDDRIMAQAIYEVEQDAVRGRGPSYTFLTFFGIWGGNCQSLAERARKRYWEIIARGAAGRNDPFAPKVQTTRLGGSQNAASMDPNEKIGPAGYGASSFVPGDSLFPYEVHFENDQSATAPAQRVKITDQLSSQLAWDTFRLTEIQWGDFTIDVPPGLQYYATTVEMTYGGVSFVVQVEAGIHLETGEVFAVFQSLDPLTELPPPVTSGFLPPEDGTGRGQGHIGYLIRPQPGLASGTPIRNVALITFDVNPAISTDQIDPHNASQGINPARQALVTIDSGLPTSSVSPLHALENARFQVQWSGTDDAAGSGIATYDVFVSDNGGPAIRWQAGVTTTFATFTGGLPGHSYQFFVIATDNVGHTEAVPATFDASTTVSTNPWQNAIDRLDIDDNRFITASDALIIINEINAFGIRSLPAVAPAVDFYLDATGDLRLTASDALDVINRINAFGIGPAEGEANMLAPRVATAEISVPAPTDHHALDALFSQWAEDDLATASKRRRKP